MGGGDLVGIQASRMTTYLHKATKSLLGTFPEGEDKILQSPCSSLCGDLPCCKCGSGKEETRRPHAMPGRVLLSLLFLILYLVAAVIQVAVLLYLCQILVYWMWKRGVDPDNAAIPYLTAIGDLLGTSLLAMAFLALEEIGDTSLDNLEHVKHHNMTHHNDSMEGVTEQVVSLLAELTTLSPHP